MKNCKKLKSVVVPANIKTLNNTFDGRNDSSDASCILAEYARLSTE